MKLKKGKYEQLRKGIEGGQGSSVKERRTEDEVKTRVGRVKRR